MDRRRGGLFGLAAVVLFLSGVAVGGLVFGDSTDQCQVNDVVGDEPYRDVRVGNYDEERATLELTFGTGDNRSQSTHCLEPGQARGVKLPLPEGEPPYRLTATLSRADARDTSDVTSRDLTVSVIVGENATISVGEAVP